MGPCEASLLARLSEIGIAHGNLDRPKLDTFHHKCSGNLEATLYARERECTFRPIDLDER